MTPIRRLTPRPACCASCRFSAWGEEGGKCLHYARRTGEVDDTIDGLDVIWESPDDVEWDNVCNLHQPGEPIYYDESTPELDAIREVAEGELRASWLCSRDRD
jgi:hypothetical protein